ncbi:MAG: hypothetical protein Q9187_000382 [Circinaria calcarea]
MMSPLLGDNGETIGKLDGNVDDTYTPRHGLVADPPLEATLPIAIVGMSCRFPGGASSPTKLWQLCAEGRSAWSEIPEDRFNQRAFYHPQGENMGTSNVLGGHFLKDDISLFDASFFNFSAEVASVSTLRAVLKPKKTGIPIEKIAGTSTSVFAGAFFRDYHDSLMRDPELLPRYFMTGNGSAMISNRISHFFDLGGPSVTVDTGCSTGLTALHLACQSIRTGDSNLAVVAGASIIINPDMFISMSNLGLLGSDGKSYSFDARASGYGRGEGVATLILKPLHEALKDGDPVRAVIRETLLNQDGKSPTITSPSQAAQEELIRTCYKKAGLDPINTTYVEAHGTGTISGDPIEAGAIGSVFGQRRPTEKPLYIGSIKSNIGHLEAASGLASVVKTVLAFEKGFIPPSINFEKPNPAILFKEWNLKVPRLLEPWPLDELRRASLSNFGYGGTNAHVIMDDSIYYDTRMRRLTNGHSSSDRDDEWRVFVLSAKDQGVAKSMIANLSDYLKLGADQNEPVVLQDLAYTLGQRRSFFPWVVTASARTLPGLIETLDNGQLKPSYSSEVPRIGFVFNGQGAQWHAMGRELIGVYSVFEESLREADKHLKELGAPWSLVDELMRDQKTSRVNEPMLSLPLCCAIQVSLVRLLRSWGINPTAVTGHSSGEASAAYAGGAIDFREALAIVYTRGTLTTNFLRKSALHGGMLAVGLSREDTEPYLSTVSSRDKVVVACVNSPSSVTLAGDLQAIEELEAKMLADKIFARRLKVAVAYHSHHMEPISEQYHASLRQYLKQNGDFGQVIYSSPVTGERIKSARELGPEHWLRNMVQPVLFAQSFRNMCIETSSTDSQENKLAVDTIVEIGPHSALAGPIRQTLTLPELEDYKISYGSCLERGQNAVLSMQNLACFLLSEGYPVDLEAVNFPRGAHGRQVIHDLPSYPWNHSVRHWMEPRKNKEYRHRQFPPHELLGSRAPGTNPMMPTWRHIIRPSEIPWVRDHLVQSDMVYPGAGCICMAIEAARQISESTAEVVSGYNLREIEIMKALVIPDTQDGIEVQITLRDCSNKTLDQNWKEFHVYSADKDGNWNEHCKGLISVKYKSPFDGTPGQKLNCTIESGAYMSRIDPRDFFERLQAVGINHGSSFRNLISIRCGQHQSVASFSIADTASLMPYKYQHDHVLHPITLDALFQAAYSTVPTSETKSMGAAIPRSIKRMFVSQYISHDAGHQFEALTTIHKQNSQGFDVSIATFNLGDASFPAPLEIEGLHYQSLGSGLVAEKTMDDSKLCMTIHWERGLSLMRLGDLKESLMIPPEPMEIALFEDLKRATCQIILDVLAALTGSDIEKLDWHHKVLYNWMMLQDRRVRLNQMAPRSSQWIKASEGVKQRLYDQVSSKSANGRMLVRIGRKLLAILRKEVAPLELMLENKLLYSYYEEALRVDRSLSQVEKLVKLFAHEHPRAKVLEIGAGTGACTRIVLRALGGGDSGVSPRFTHYDLTDISSGFFEAAREKFGAWGDMISYNKLDVEQDAEQQSFILGSYDLIIACQVLHATKCMEHTMTNVRRLLKPGGKLIMVETTQDAIDVQLVFGTLSGWWLSEEEERKHSPNLSVDSWERLLKQTGFSGLDVEVRDSEDDENYAMSVIMSTATAEASSYYQHETAIVHASFQPPEPWLNTLKELISAVTFTETVIGSLGNIDVDGKVCIFIDTDDAVLSRMDASCFAAIKNILNGARGVLWVSRGGAIDCERPEHGLCTGLLRTLRLEDSSKRFVALDLDPRNGPWTATGISTILDLFKLTFDYGRDKSLMDFEYAERDSLVYVPRLYDDPAMNDAAGSDTTTNSTPELQPFYQPGRELRMIVGTPGSLDSLVFVDDPSAGEALPDDFVEIEPKAFGLNFRDIMVAMGQLQETTMGFECSGVITKVGSNATHSFKVGDRVCALTTRGHWASFIRIHWTGVGKIPDHMTFELAASIPMVFVTAYYSLHEIARLQKGETVLIHAATGGVGQAAIILAQHIGAEIFVTVGSQEKRDFIIKTYGIDNDHILSSRDRSFAPNVMRLTHGKGVDVVLNSLAGQLLQESWNCVATLGRFIEIGKRDIQLNRYLEMEPLGRATSFTAIDLIHLGNHRGKVMSRVMADVLRLLDERAIQPVSPITVYPISEIQRAFRLMQAGKHMGKIIVKLNKGDLVSVISQKRPVKLLADASYLIVGGLGGIGRSIAQWFVQHGAKHLVLLSRSAASQTSSGAFLEQLKATGCNIVTRNCNISERSELARAVNACTEGMPPVRGVINAAMVLQVIDPDPDLHVGFRSEANQCHQDSVFEYMPYHSWEAAIRPKVQGTHNLHEVLSSHNLDFFIMLSSATGVLGNPSQANYAAGGTFQDAFARYRTAKGLPAVSIDLGMVKSVGYVAETKGVAERLAQIGYRPLEEAEVLQIIEAAIRAPIREQHSSQIITGLAPFDMSDSSDGIFWRQEPRFLGLRRIQSSSISASRDSGKKDYSNFKDSLGKTSSWTAAVKVVTTAIVKKMSEMFLIPEQEIDESMPLSKYGVDSLVAVEMRNWLVSRAQAELSIFDVLQSATLTILAAKVAAKSRYVAEAGVLPLQV